MLVRFVSLVALLVFVFIPPAQAEDPVAEVQAVIAGQIDALVAEDADRAYSYASPDIRSLYPDKDSFLAMVQQNYEGVQQAGNYAFGRSKLVAVASSFSRK